MQVQKIMNVEKREQTRLTDRIVYIMANRWPHQSLSCARGSFENTFPKRAIPVSAAISKS